MTKKSGPAYALLAGKWADGAFVTAHTRAGEYPGSLQGSGRKPARAIPPEAALGPDSGQLNNTAGFVPVGRGIEFRSLGHSGGQRTGQTRSPVSVRSRGISSVKPTS